MLIIEFKDKVNVKRIEEVVEMYDCCIIMIVNENTTNPKFTVSGTSDALEKLKKHFENT